MILGNMHMEGHRRRLECNHGYLPLDLNNVTSQCQNGRWTNVTTCVQVCPKFEKINLGKVAGDSIYENATRHLICDDGYSPLDPAKLVSQCTKGEWTEITKCVPDCGTLSAPMNGEVDLSQGIKFGAKASFTCQTGFTLEGLPSPTCTSAGTWSSAAPLCQINDKNLKWQNKLDGLLDYACPNKNQFINHVISQHHNHKEDRQFDFTCSDVVSGYDDSTTTCTYSGWVNEFDQPVNFRCPDDGFIHGMRSEHNNHHEDRKWDFFAARFQKSA
ncbi:E-selectin-like [Dreissena polymorpha]|uniref:Sushi domain-containing protein n=1 Tax=Dreissena polymorpha TaxID=45954 RepID=A0A9D4HG36_DREPO|nr:E-selectin-like [Dreissena polymorpha]XP_052246576.1 E-selectin-like [Dreissena polymorpha]KAH3716254.1 hypothetical protein DPMN_058973 [Dreissena polymorpha]